MITVQFLFSQRPYNIRRRRALRHDARRRVRRGNRGHSRGVPSARQIWERKNICQRLQALHDHNGGQDDSRRSGGNH